MQVFDEMIDNGMMSLDMTLKDIEDIIRDVIQTCIYLITDSENPSHTWVTWSLGFNIVKV